MSPDQPSSESLWYKDAVIYEVPVRAYADSNGDGIGDFRGLTDKLAHIEDLGVTAVWLLPFYPSPLRDDGYDIADYKAIHPDYGTLDDFRRFLEEAHRRGLKVITELVLNHTSDQHPWFQRARHAPPGSPERDFYVWSDTPERYRDARIIFKDTETSNWAWDPVSGAYYWHRFFSHQPDLNYENAAVREAVYDVIDFWLGMGVDGLRLDAVPYLFEEEGTMCENLPATHRELKAIRRYVDERYADRMLLAEANQWPEDAIAYFGDGDECHMAYHFPLMPRLFMAISQENRFPVIDILDQTPPIPPNAQWAIFLRNHDELTLEMVTDEERDYMYRTYARDQRARLNLGIRRRLAPLLVNNRRLIELMGALLFSLPGTPVFYYGDEIGMGDNIYLGDRNGVRTPMQWSSDRNAGFSTANPQRLYLPVIIDPEYHFETVNVANQRTNPNSLLWWTKRMLALRKQHRVFGRGSIEFIQPANPKVLAFLRCSEEETVLVVANLSRHNQFVELDLAGYAGRRPLEMMGRNYFPTIAEAPYVMTIGPHAFYWFALETAEVLAGPAPEREIQLDGALALQGQVRSEVEAALAPYLAGRVWYRGRNHKVRYVRISDSVPLPVGESQAVLVEVEYYDAEQELYQLLLAVAMGEEAGRVLSGFPDAVVARVQRDGETGVLYDPVWDPHFTPQLMAALVEARHLQGERGRISINVAGGLPDSEGEPGEPELMDSPDGHTTLTYGHRWAVKVLRRVEPGINPDLELRSYLTHWSDFDHLPPVEGWAEYADDGIGSTTLAIVQTYVPHTGDAWDLMAGLLGRFYEAIAAGEEIGAPHPPAQLLDLISVEPPAEVAGLIDTERQMAELLGVRTGELHVALASYTGDSELAAEGFSQLYQRSAYQSIRSSIRQVLHYAARRVEAVPKELRAELREVVRLEDEMLDRLGRLLERRIQGKRIRIHGDYRLDQVLFTGNDFVVFDFAGDTTRPLSERRLKRSPLRDVASMLRSLHYAAYAALFAQEQLGVLTAEQVEELEPWAQVWYAWMGAAFLRGYLEKMSGTDILPADPDQGRSLLEAFLLEKAVRELGWEIDHRPGWVRIPLIGIAELLAHGH